MRNGTFQSNFAIFYFAQTIRGRQIKHLAFHTWPSNIYFIYYNDTQYVRA